MLTKHKKRKLSFVSILFTYFVDILGWCIVFPIFAPLFLDPENMVFSREVALTTRTTILGFFLAAYPVAQFFGSPLLGEMGDKYGRKNALMLSVFLTFIGYALSAWSIHIHSLWLLFFSRVISGVFSGNLSICMAAISDLSVDEKSKIKNFSYISILAGFAFIIGPFIGGKFSDRTIYSAFSAGVPLQMAALLSLFNFFFLIFGFHETTEVQKNVKFNFLESVQNIAQALQIKKLKIIYSIYFLYLFAWVILMQFTPVLVIEKFQFTNSEIGNMAAFMGVCWVIGSFIVQKELFKEHSFKILEIILLIFTACCFFVVFPNNMWLILFIVSLAMLVCGIAWPICTGIISNMATQKMQGKIMGMSQSMQSLAMTIGPIVGGFVVHFSKELTFFSAALASLVASIIYFRVKL